MIETTKDSEHRNIWQIKESDKGVHCRLPYLTYIDIRKASIERKYRCII